MNPMLTYLALGDSYTIGEGCPIYESFPYQTMSLLRTKGVLCSAPEIVAKTGWSTSELSAQLRSSMLLPGYDIVTLLIGVNNHYRGLSSASYAHEFEEILEEAIRRGTHVFVLSIPDWGLTPYAAGRDRTLISQEIAEFNSINRNISDNLKVSYSDITTSAPETISNEGYLVADGLHPSGKAYARWAKSLTDNILSAIN